MYIQTYIHTHTYVHTNTHTYTYMYTSILLDHTHTLAHHYAPSSCRVRSTSGLVPAPSLFNKNLTLSMCSSLRIAFGIKLNPYNLFRGLSSTSFICGFYILEHSTISRFEPHKPHLNPCRMKRQKGSFI